MKIGLSIEELDSVLKEYIGGNNNATAENMRKAISTAIEANNQKILEDIKKLISE